VIGVVVRVDEVSHLVADAVGRSDFVDRPPDVASDARRRVEENYAVLGGEERRLVAAVCDPVQVPFHASDVVALVVECGSVR